MKEAKELMRRMMPVAQRVLGKCDTITLRMRWIYTMALHKDPDATLDDLREAMTTLEDLARISRRVLGSAHPLVVDIESDLPVARAKLHEASV